MGQKVHVVQYVRIVFTGVGDPPMKQQCPYPVNSSNLLVSHAHAGLMNAAGVLSSADSLNVVFANIYCKY